MNASIMCTITWTKDRDIVGIAMSTARCINIKKLHSIFHSQL